LQCAKHEKGVKNRQSELKLFSVLIYSQLFIFKGAHEIAIAKYLLLFDQAAIERRNILFTTT